MQNNRKSNGLIYSFVLSWASDARGFFLAGHFKSNDI